MSMIKMFAPLIVAGFAMFATAAVIAVVPAQAGSGYVSPDDPGSGGSGNGGRRR